MDKLHEMMHIERALVDALSKRLKALKPIDVIPTVNDVEKIYKMYSELVDNYKETPEAYLSLLVELAQNYPKDIKYEDKFSTILDCFYDISDSEIRIARAYALIHQEVSSLSKFIDEY